MTILEAGFCSFCNLSRADAPQDPQTGQQYLRLGSTKLLCSIMRFCLGKYRLDYFNTPIPLETFMIVTPPSNDSAGH